MRVLLLAETDNAQQNFLLAQAMRKYLGWEAKSMVCRETYLGYPTDWTVEKDMDEAAEYARDTDLFILQDQLFDFEEIPLRKRATHKNTIINGTGSRLRERVDYWRMEQFRGWKIFPMQCDTTLSTKLCAPPFENWICPIEQINALTTGIEKNNKISVCHAPTKIKYKGTEQFEAILNPYIESGEIEYKRITGLTWEEAIKEKAKYHIILDSLGDTHYNAGNSLEGLVLGQTVVSNIDPWCYCLHPDLPMTTLWNSHEGRNIKGQFYVNMTRVIRETIEKEKIGGLFVEKEKAKEWVKEHFGAENQIVKWANYIRWVQER